jgi:ribonucleoside-diphosphate reductase alpha chain
MEKWIKGIDYPDFMTNESLVTITKQHLRDNETPKMLYERIVNTLSNTLLEMYLSQANYDLDKATKLAKKAKELWFKYLWKGWLSPSTPILANCGTDNGYTISCYVIRVPDTLEGIFDKVREAALLTKYGGGVGITWDKVRGRGEKISKGGFSEGVVPFIKVGDSTVLATSQGATRRGAFSNNLPIRHKDINEFLNIRLPEGDVNRQCLNSNHCVTCDDYFMESVVNGDTNSRELYAKLISSRMKTGQPYVMYYHNVHNQRPNDMKKRNLKIDGTNLCSEILSFHDKDHTVVCDLASVNIAKYDEWKNDKDFIEYSLLFLDANLELYILIKQVIN